MRNQQRRLFIAIFLAPAFLLFTVFVAWPSVRALAYSLQKWDGLTEPEWVGLKNFATLFQQGDMFRLALWHNAIIMVCGGSATVLLALFFAALMHRRVRGANIFRVTFFFPNVLSSVAIALLWILLYSPSQFGVFNGILAKLDLAAYGLNIDVPVPFTGKSTLIYAIIPMMVWMAVGFYMVLFLAAMEGIPETFYEVARLEGASEFAQFFHITFPLIREVFVVGLVFLVIGTLKFFEPVWIMDNQWPSKDTHVLATLLYQRVFSEYRVGEGSAIAVILFLLVLVATLFTLRLSRKEALEY
ncbi:MAG: sugar ABC transporter permease [Candidatus Hydrogenedentes bacterium]|nr:sugar ABC transporter permease [Candidatus Hydrogenedentota bacterium]